jgi:hypothetical protein
MNKRTGAVSSLTLSYDMVFFALVRSVLAGDKYIIKKKRCIAHPLKKRAMIMRSPSLDYTARVNSLLVYYKLRDDVKDERGAKKAAAGALLGAFAGVKKRASGLSELERQIESSLAELSDIEAEKCPSPDEAAEAFGKTLAACLAFGLPEGRARIAHEVGRHIGRAVYLADAACDFWKDRKSNSYNPFLLAFGGEMGKEEEQRAKNSVLLELSALERTLMLLDYTDFAMARECIMNVAVFGIKQSFFSEFEKEKANDKSLHSARS